MTELTRQSLHELLVDALGHYSVRRRGTVRNVERKYAVFAEGKMFSSPCSETEALILRDQLTATLILDVLEDAGIPVPLDGAGMGDRPLRQDITVPMGEGRMLHVPKVTPLVDVLTEVARAATGADTRSRSRAPHVVHARAAIVVTLSEEGWSSVRIGRRIGRDHCTVLHCLKQRPVYARADPEFEPLVATLKSAAAGWRNVLAQKEAHA